MGWSNVPICDDHWIEEEGGRIATRLVASVRDPNDRCYRCGRRTEGILVRRNIPDEAGRIIAGCTRCGKEVSGQTTAEAAIVVLGMTYDDVAICLVFHAECLREADKVHVPPRKSDGMNLIDAIDIGAVNANLDDLYPDTEPDQEADYTCSQPDRVEDA